MSTKIENATEIIDRFGGIRPMAKKIDVAVTTVQGWKKRDVIPGRRKTQILNAAAANKIDLSDLLPDGKIPDSANENKHPTNKTSDRPASEDKKEGKGTEQEPAPPAVPPTETYKKTSESYSKPEMPSAQGIHQQRNLERILAETEKNAVTKSTWITVILILIVVAVIALLLWPASNSSVSTQRLSSLESNISQMKEDLETVQTEQSFLTKLIPKDIDLQISMLQDQAREAQKKIAETIEKAGTISADLVGQNAGGFGDRLEKLENYIAGKSNTFDPNMLKYRLETLKQTTEGQQTLQKAFSELKTLTETVQASQNPDWNTAISEARQENPFLNEILENVPLKYLKTAVFMLSAAQMNTALNENNAPFKQEYLILNTLMGENYPLLRENLNKLAPYIERGVLTPEGLKEDFKNVAEETVKASISGDNVSLDKRIKTRLGSLLQVEKDGEPITGTETQIILTRAKNYLDAQKIEQAVTELTLLEGPAAETIRPWLYKARATILAQNAQQVLRATVNQINTN